MPTCSRTYIDNGCYHIVARGNQKQRIFFNDNDYLYYLILLKKYKKQYSFKLYGYCLMPNHIHLIGQIKKAVNISKLIHTVHRTYTGYFNNKHNKVGHLWQGRFKSKVIVKNAYLNNCACYIELNPVRANIVSNPEEYIWSSFNERNMLNAKITLLDSWGTL